MTKYLEDFINYDVAASEETLLKHLKEEKLSQEEMESVILKSSEMGFLDVLKYIVPKYNLVDCKDSDINYALCWASLAPNAKEVFLYLINSGKFDVTWDNNQPLMWALENNYEAKIRCEDIARYILDSGKIKLSNNNIDEIYEWILEDLTTSYENVVVQIFSLIKDKERAQNFFELLVSKSYFNAVSKICKDNNEINFFPALMESIEVDDEKMSEILSEYIVPNDSVLFFCLKHGMKDVFKKLLKKGEFEVSTFSDAMEIAIENNDYELVSIISKYI